MLKRNRICILLLFVIVVSSLFFCKPVFASTGSLGQLNYDVSSYTEEEVSYLKACCDAVLDYCNANGISLDEYSYYCMLSVGGRIENPVAIPDQEFIIALGREFLDVNYYTDGALKGQYGIDSTDNHYYFIFDTGSTTIKTIGHYSNYGCLFNDYFYVYYNNVPNDLVTANDDIDFFHIPSQGILGPIVRQSPTKRVLEEVVKVLPVVLLTLVGLIGLRKALVFLQKVLHRS